MTLIEWTHETWNPIRARATATGKLGWHCTHASPGCVNCYAERLNRKPGATGGTGFAYKPGHLASGEVEVFLDEKALVKPLGWRKSRKVFVCSMTDLFADFVTDEMRDRVFAIMALCPHLTFQVLTKRADRMRAYLCSRAGDWMNVWPDANPSGSLRFSRQQQRIMMRGWADGSHPATVSFPLPNVWLGVSVEDQQRADERIPDLLATPAAVRWLSCEPLLGPVDLTEIPIVEPLLGLPKKSLGACTVKEAREVLDGDGQVNLTLSALEIAPFAEYNLGATKLDWIVVGGESGPCARPMHPDWARQLRDQCAAAGVPYFFKQWGEWEPRELWSGHLGGGRFETMLAIMPDGSRCPDDVVPQDVGAHRMARVGKKRAGRLLDGRTHDEFPADLVVRQFPG